MTLPVFDLSTDPGRAAFAQRLAHLRESVSTTGEPARVVAEIIDAVRRDGDAAVVRYMQQWTDPQFSAERIVVRKREIDAAEKSLPSDLRAVITTAIAHVREYQEHIKPRDPSPVTIGGAELGLRFTPMASVGLTVPGGRAVLFSSVIMLAVPAMVAGVDPAKISVTNPPPTRREGEVVGDISPLVLATCRLLGIEKVYRIGGAQAVAALALGTSTIAPVDFIAGPGNVYSQLAKQQLRGRVGTDDFYGPSEIVTIADDTADPRRVASDLIAQAEHDPGRCFLVAWSRDVIDRINGAIAEQMRNRKRTAAIEGSFKDWSGGLLVKDEAAAAEVADTIAAEHVNLAVRDPKAWLSRLKNGGEFFLGDQTPVAAGDYLAGPSHCLPTGTTARFASGISVYTFLKRSGTVSYPKGMDRATIEAIACLAQAEGLDGHAESVRVRGS